MSDRPEAVLFGRGEDREPVAAMTVEMLAAHGLSPINPALGLVRAFDVHGDEQLLPDTAAAVAALADRSCVAFCDRDIELANALLYPTTIFGGAPAKADYCIDLGHEVFVQGEAAVELPRFLATWLELAQRVDLVVGYVSSEWSTEPIRVARNHDTLRAFVEGRSTDSCPIAVVWNPSNYRLDAVRGEPWTTGTLRGRVYSTSWRGESVRDVLLNDHA